MKTTNSWAKCLYAAWLIVIPFAAQAFFVIATRALDHYFGPGYGDIGFVTPVLSTIVGLVFVTRLMTPSQKVLIALIYFPVMYVLLTFLSLGFIGYVYDDWL